MISLGYDYTIRVTTDEPLPNLVLGDIYQAVNDVLATHCTNVNYDTTVDAPIIAASSSESG